ncbi:MAG: cytochrome c biogenesis protein CcsA [Deltaproteobacteria bacterium]|nr:cytochrome c biogenesis protein CcsA [Deltaproteobacteria bacterium]
MFVVFSLIAILFFAFAQYWALAIAPPEKWMGDVYRILFVHVPAAWNALLMLSVSFVASILYLIKRKPFYDRLAASSSEVGVVLTGLTLMLGSIWGKPTWGVWWTWDPRLTTTAILFLLYMGYQILRRLIDDAEQRAKISAALGTMIFLNVPIVYFSVKWWRTLHQLQSSPQTVAPEMVLPLRLNAFAILGLALIFLWMRMRIARLESQKEEQ